MGGPRAGGGRGLGHVLFLRRLQHETRQHARVADLLAAIPAGRGRPSASGRGGGGHGTLFAQPTIMDSLRKELPLIRATDDEARVCTPSPSPRRNL